MISTAGSAWPPHALTETDVRKHAKDLADALYKNIPCGVGSTGHVKLSAKEVKKVLISGSQWAVKNGFGENSDIEHTEDNGCLENADPSIVSDRGPGTGEESTGDSGLRQPLSGSGDCKRNF